ncbi:MAG: hypothetical protein K2M87_08455 [Muribaculaceae bacterium]|nr:hypothetical protein [Muribaculaceae bacterium]
MYTLISHISYLLTRHSRVEVPGIGVFEVCYLPARYDVETSSWLPMSRKLSLEASQVYFSEGELLLNSYMRKHGVSSEAAYDRIKRGVDEVLAIIDSEGEVALGNIGILSRVESRLSLTPRFSPSEYSKAIGREAACDSDRNAQIDTSESTSDAAKADEMSSRVKIGDREFDFKRNWYLPINKMFVRSAACVALLALMILSVILPSDRTARMVDQANVIPVESLIRKAVEVEEGVEKKQSETAVKKASEAKVTHDSVEESKYYLIVATLATPDKAEEYVRMRGEDGKGLEIVSTSTRSRVSAASSSDREKLVKKMQDAEFQNKFPQAWIWEK